MRKAYPTVLMDEQWSPLKVMLNDLPNTSPKPAQDNQNAPHVYREKKETH